MRGLLIKSPHIELILEGRKTSSASPPQRSPRSRALCGIVQPGSAPRRSPQSRH